MRGFSLRNSQMNKENCLFSAKILKTKDSLELNIFHYLVFTFPIIISIYCTINCDFLQSLITILKGEMYNSWSKIAHSHIFWLVVMLSKSTSYLKMIICYLQKKFCRLYNEFLQIVTFCCRLAYCVMQPCIFFLVFVNVK